MKSFKSYQHQRILTAENEIANGDYIIGGEMTIRTKNGYLCDGADEKGNALPAIELANGTHIEHWLNGVLHCEKEPAVIDNVDGYEEWWLNGKQVSNPNPAPNQN